MSISKKLIIAFFTITIPPILASMAFTFWEVSTQLEAQTMEQLRSIATRQGNRVSSVFMKWTEKVNDFSSRGELRILLGELQKEGSSENVKKINELLLGYEKSLVEIEMLAVVDGDMTILASSKKDIVGKNMAEVFGVGTELLDEKILVVKEHLAENDYSTELFFSKEVKTIEGETNLIMEIGPSEIIAIARDYSALGKTGETVLGDVAKNGEVIFLSPLRFDNEYREKQKIYIDNEGSPIVKALKGKQEDLYDAVDYRDKEILAVTRYLDLSGWGVVVKIDKDEALSVLEELRISYMIVASTALFLIVFVAWYYAKIFTKPIVELSEMTRAIARSRRFKNRVEVSSNDELGQLASSFNLMIQELELSYEELESRVKNRTEELNQNMEKLKRMNKVMLGRELKMVELKKEIKKCKNKK